MITTYGSGATVIPAGVAITNAAADIICYVPTAVNGLGFQDFIRGGKSLFKGSVAINASSAVQTLTYAANTRGYILDINALYDGVVATSGIAIYASYSVNSGSSYSSPELVATVSGRVIFSRIYVEYRTLSITNVQYTFTNIDTTYPCKSLNVIATPYR